MKNDNILSIESMLTTLGVNSNNEISSGVTYVGIDFGTSTTVVSIASFCNGNKKIEVTPIELIQILDDGTKYYSQKIPSIIAWYNNSIYVGEGASNLKYKLRKGRDIWFSFKMEIGEDLGAKYFDSSLKDHPKFKIRNPKDCVRVFFAYLKMVLNKYCDDNNLSKNIKYAISIPASFEANQRKDLVDALKDNDILLSNASLIDEPNAAFLSYVYDRENSFNPLFINPVCNSNVLVFDFGGGTCDISILEVGKSINGIYSKNIAISKFAKLGGDDVDRYITYKYLLPRFLENNNYELSDFLTNEKHYLATQLYKIAERLKILLSKRIIIQMKDLKIPNSVRENKEKESVRYLLEVITSKGVLKQEDFYLSVAEFIEVMSVFTSETKTCIRGQEEYNTILMPLDSALKKAKLHEDNIDYVLLIGGSAQNPFIQEAIKEKFTDSKILIPQDLQTHVSQGTAIHSILVNAFGKCVIQPITSEPILVITKDMLLLPKIVMPAGTSIPSDTFEVNDLVTSREGQTEIELPICVGNKNKILFNLIIQLQKAVPINTPVQLVMKITADKLLYATANCDGVECTIEPQNPFANKELSTEERIVLRAERQANLEALQNDGVPTKNALINLRNAYEEVGNDFRAAETMEYLEQLYPSAANYNKIGVLYSNAGNKSKALKFYELAYENSPENGIINFNLGHSLLEIDSDRARRLLKRSHEINPEHAPTLITLSRLEKESENIDKSNEYRLKAYDILIKKWKTDTLKGSEYSWLESVANELGYKDIACQVRASQEKLKQDEYYNDENLTITKITSIQKF